MYYRCNAGGWNRSHGQIERTPRIDSFELPLGKPWRQADRSGRRGQHRPPLPDRLAEMRNGEAVTQAQRIRRTTDLFPLPPVWGEGAVPVPERRSFSLPQMRPPELPQPAANRGQHDPLRGRNGLCKPVLEVPGVCAGRLFLCGICARETAWNVAHNLPPLFGKILPLPEQAHTAPDTRPNPDHRKIQMIRR